MDLTLEDIMSTPEEATAARQFVQAYDTAMALASDKAARMLIWTQFSTRRCHQ